VQDLLSSSECLGVTIPETVALQHLLERVDQWTQRATTALASDSIARILHQEKPTNSDSEHPVPTSQSDSQISIQTSPDLGIAIK